MQWRMWDVGWRMAGRARGLLIANRHKPQASSLKPFLATDEHGSVGGGFTAEFVERWIGSDQTLVPRPQTRFRTRMHADGFGPYRAE